MKYLSIILSVIAITLSGYTLWQYHSVVGTEPQPITDPTFMKSDNIDPQAFLNARSWDLPDTMTFAGEIVPLEKTHVREMLDRELHINTYWHNNTIFLIKRAHRWLKQMEPILAENGIPDDFKYVTVIESNLMNVVSPASAAGFWQFMKPTAKEYGLEVGNDVDERYHPLKATKAAAMYLQDAYRKFNDWTLVAAAYNRGMAGMQRALDDQGVDNYYDLYLNQETARYMYRILAIKEILSNPDKYGFDIKEEHLYETERVEYVAVDKSINDLKEWAKTKGVSYLLLKRHNPWLTGNRLRIRESQSYSIAIPLQ